MKYLGAITNDYDLVTKKYVDDAAEVIQTITSGVKIGSVGGTDLYAPQGGGGGGDMYKSTYDTNNSGVVDNAEALGGVALSGLVQQDANGNVSIAGTLTVKSHSSAIGSTVGNYTGTYSLASGTTWVSVPTSGITRLSLTAGVWIVTAHAAFPSNNTGRRAMQLYNFTTSGSISRSFVNQTATSGAPTNMVTTAILDYSASNSIGLQLVQNSGSSQSVDLQLYAVRIA